MNDHVLFEECIESFRAKDQPFFFPAGKSASIILTSFKIDEDWVWDDFKIYSSREVKLSDGHIALVSRIDNPDTVGVIRTQEFGIVIATLLSFVSGRPVRAPQVRVFRQVRELIDAEWAIAGLTFPLSTCGNDVVFYKRKLSWQHAVRDDLRSLIVALREINYSEFKESLLAIRLINLSINNKKTDFALAYSLAVAGLESIAQKAIDIEKFKIPKETLAEWKRKCADDEALKALYSKVAQNNSSDKFSGKRFVEFVFLYAPIDQWNYFVEHPMQDLVDARIMDDEDFERYYGKPPMAEMSAKSFMHLVRKSINDVYPEDLEEEQLRKIFTNVYSHRSSFLHAGEQPPHQHAVGHDRYFQVILDNRKVILLANYELLLGVSRLAITNWISSRLKRVDAGKV